MTPKNYTFVVCLYCLMKQRTLLVLLILLTCSLHVVGQDQSNFTQFYLNPYILNPSYAGIDGKTAVSLIYRKQWSGIDGGPSIGNFSLHTPVNPKLSTGISFNNDKRGLLNHSTFLLSFGYNIQLQKTSFLRFGVSAGGNWNTVKWDQITELNDTRLGASLLDNHASLAGNAGMSFHGKTFHFGVSIPNIFSPSVASPDGFNVSEVKPFQSLIIHGSNRFYFAENKHVFEPYAVYRLNSGIPSQYEVAALVHLNHTIWFGGSFKEEFGISALGGIKLQNILAIGASYSLPSSGENQLASPSFEISLNYLLGQHKKGTLVYSFVDTHLTKKKKHKPGAHSASEAIAQKRREEEQAKKKMSASELAKKREEEAAAKRREAEELAKHQAEVQKRIEERKHEVVVAKPLPPDPKQDTAVNHNPRFRQEMNVPAQPMEGHHEHEKEQISRLEVHAEDPTEHHNEEGHPHAERHEFVKRGNHQSELPVSDYVVGGVFRSEPNAKHFSEGLDKLGFDTHYGHLTEKNLWYVYVIQTDDINKARAERDRVRKMKILRDAWLLTVHH